MTHDVVAGHLTGRSRRRHVGERHAQVARELADGGLGDDPDRRADGLGALRGALPPRRRARAGAEGAAGAADAEGAEGAEGVAGGVAAVGVLLEEGASAGVGAWVLFGAWFSAYMLAVFEWAI